jgi:hypothetical protein
MRSYAGKDTEVNILVQGSDEYYSNGSDNNPVLVLDPGAPDMVVLESDRVNQWLHPI